MNRHARRAAGTPRPAEWEPLVEVDPSTRSFDAIAIRGTAERHGVSDAEAKAMLMNSTGLRVFRNSTYTVDMWPAPSAEGWVSLSIQRLDGAPRCPWADKQRIKNQIIGAECEAVELFPAESRLVDVGNVYHLWCNTDADDRLTLGWHEGRRVK